MNVTQTRNEGICRYVEAAKCTSSEAGGECSYLASIVAQSISIVIATGARLPSYGRFCLLRPASSFSRCRFHGSFAGSAQIVALVRHIRQAESSSDNTQGTQEDLVQMFVETKASRAKWQF